MEDNIDEHLDEVEDNKEDEDDLWFQFKAQMEESENFDDRFPEGDVDESISDYMTKE